MLIIRLAAKAPRLRGRLTSNVRQSRVNAALRRHRGAAMGREVTASSGTRCQAASVSLVRFVLALGRAPAPWYERALVVRYPSQRQFRRGSPRHRAAQRATHRWASLLGSTAFLVRCVLPNPSVERTSTGMPLGPRRSSGHHPPRGPSAIPAPARSPQTLGRKEVSWRIAAKSKCKSRLRAQRETGAARRSYKAPSVNQSQPRTHMRIEASQS